MHARALRHSKNTLPRVQNITFEKKNAINCAKSNVATTRSSIKLDPFNSKRKKAITKLKNTRVHTVHLLRRKSTNLFFFFFFLPVNPYPGAQNVTNSAKSVLLAAKAIVSVARYCYGATHQLDGCRGLGHTSPPLPSPLSSDGTAAFHRSTCCFFKLVEKKKVFKKKKHPKMNPKNSPADLKDYTL